MRAREFLSESMSLNPSKLELKDDGYKYLNWVFPSSWTREHDWSGISYDSDEEPKLNPDYKPEYDFNLSNANMHDLMGQLGFSSEEDSYAIPIDEFINRAQVWLRDHIDKPSGGLEPHEEPREISGQNINYDFLRSKLTKQRTSELQQDSEFQAKIQRMYNNVKYAIPREETYEEFYQKWLDRYVRMFVNNAISTERAKHETPIGPRIIHGGRKDNYFNEKIMKALKIAQKGKSMGADYISIA